MKVTKTKKIPKILHKSIIFFTFVIILPFAHPGTWQKYKKSYK